MVGKSTAVAKKSLALSARLPLAKPALARSAEERFQSNFGHNAEGLLADLEKSGLQMAGVFVRTIIASLVKFLRHARLERDGSVKEAVDVGHGNFFRLLHQVVPSAGALLALHVTAALEVQQNQLEELLGNVRGFRDVVR